MKHWKALLCVIDAHFFVMLALVMLVAHVLALLEDSAQAVLVSNSLEIELWRAHIERRARELAYNAIAFSL
eukprot:91108-Amphidinium_carterae.1